MTLHYRSIIASLALCAAAAVNAAGYETAKDIPYRDTTDEYASKMCLLDVAYVPGATDKPVVVWYHSGGLVGGSRGIPRELLRDSMVVVDVEYRLSPHATIDEILDDSALATAWVFENIAQYGGDTNNIFLAGHSAGGYIIDLLGLDKSLLGKYGVDADQVAGLIPLSGQTITHYEVRNQQGIPPLQATIDKYAPLYHVRADAPPMLIVSADREMELYGRYEEQAYFWRMLKLVGHPDVTLYEMDGYDHGGMPYPAYPLMIKFIKNHKR